MAILFNYKTLKVSIRTKSKSIYVFLNRPERENRINLQMVFELENFFNWLTQHLEVRSVIISSELDIFSEGLDYEEIGPLGDWKAKELIFKFQKLIYSLFFLPQAIIFNLRKKAIGMGLEFSIGGDIRVAENNSELRFDHFDKGIIPTCGGVGLLGAIIPKSYLKKWLLTGLKLDPRESQTSGLIQSFYEGKESGIEDYWAELFFNIPPVGRIQLKRALLEPILPDLEQALIFEKKFFEAAMAAEDWKVDRKNGEKFKAPNDMKELLRESSDNFILKD